MQKPIGLQPEPAFTVLPLNIACACYLLSVTQVSTKKAYTSGRESDGGEEKEKKRGFKREFIETTERLSRMALYTTSHILKPTLSPTDLEIHLASPQGGIQGAPSVA